ncbi:hypothetical protein BC831DRAFT_462364 [Entophlyctis helioformis]|nr:hypothetical protein BC831DRAFT_462364 [Entophlyctis helioformis]
MPRIHHQVQTCSFNLCNSVQCCCFCSASPLTQPQPQMPGSRPSARPAQQVRG